jgi:beta-galactosidase
MKKIGFFIQSISLLVFVLVCLGCSQQEKKPEFKVSGAKLPNTFLLGSHLCRFPMPSTKELFADMVNLKKHGFNLIKIQTHWAVDEPLEGQYEFEKYDSIVQHAKDLGLYVYIGFTLEQAPIWLYQKYPDCRMVGRNGLPVQYESPYTLPSDGKPGPCFDQPDSMAKQIQ